MSAPRPFETDPFHPLGSICYIRQLLYIYKNLSVISSMWDAQVCIYDNCACALTETLTLRFRANFKVIFLFPRVLGCMLVRIDTKFPRVLGCMLVRIDTKFAEST